MNRREFSYYLLLATMVVFLVGLGTAATWYATPRIQTEWVHRLAVADYPPSEIPYSMQREGHYFWLVNRDGAFLALNPVSPDGWGCFHAWNMPNMRFENPCSGSKYGLDGSWVEGDVPLGLGRYLVEVEGDRVVVRIPRPVPLLK